MEIDLKYFNERREKTKLIYGSHKSIFSPYFKTQIIMNSDGFHHPQFSARRERSKGEQLLKFNLLPLALEIIKKAGTIQEYRKILTPVGKPSGRDGSVAMKEVQYWGLVGIVGEKQIKVKTILRKVGDGNVTFWSVMPYSKFKHGHQKLFDEGIEDE